VALALPLAAALVLGLGLGGSIGRLGELRLRAWWLFVLAIGLQVLAFPFTFLPWRTDGEWAMTLWLVSYALLALGAGLNRRIRGVLLVTAGMGANLVAIVANGGTMPVLPEAMHGAGENYSTYANSTASTHPNVPWLVDRWAAPEWIPLANVFSVGDVLIAAGAVVLVLAAMGVARPRLRRPAAAS
jgi:Family of unknown function (DUF5317)